MKKRILLLLVAMIGMATNMGWAQDKLTVDGVLCYANGHPVTITQGSEGNVKITVDGTDESVEIASTGAVYGGSKDSAVVNTSIKMTSGKITSLYGGGNGQNVVNTNITVTDSEITNMLAAGGRGTAASSGDVTGTATMTITNTKVNIVVSGGREFAKTNEVKTTITGDNTEIITLMGGGYAPTGVAGQSLETEYANIANGIEKSTLSMTGGTITEYFFVGGGFSYSYSKEVAVTITGVTIHGGLLGVGSNGRSDNVTVNAKDCIFGGGTISPVLIAAVNRGRVDSISMTFDNCTFPTSDYFCHLGAAQGWKNGDYPIPTSNDATFTFTGESERPVVKVSQGINNLTLTGAAALVDEVAIDKSGNNISSFTIPEGKTWSFNNGLEIVSGATLTNEGILAVKDTFAIQTVDQLPLALSGAAAGGTISFSNTVTAEAMLTKLNAETTKNTFTPGICILCSDATIYTDEASAWGSTAIGTVKYIKLDNGTYSLVVPEAKTPTITANSLTASTIEAGQPLSSSILKGGAATVDNVLVSGVFSWMDPAELASTTTNKYNAIFTPNDLIKYAVVEDIEVTIAGIKQYYTVTTGKSENGTIAIVGGNSAGKYVKDTTLTITATPVNAHYEFSAGTNNGTYKVEADTVLTATFVAKNYAVTFGENVKVTKQGETTAIESGATLSYGTVLHVVAVPAADDGSLNTLTCNGKGVINNTVTVDSILTIAATFNTVVPATYRISLGETVANGNILLFDAKGNEIAFGSMLSAETVVSVVPLPDPGYQLAASNGVTVSGATYANGKFTVAEADITVSAAFQKKTFTVTNNSANATITLDKTTTPIEYGTEIKITKAEAATDYKLLAVVVNGKEIAVGESFIVKGETTVNAVTQKLPAVVFADLAQTHTYNGKGQAFVVRTIPAGISDISIKYEKVGSGSKSTELPMDAGTYNVFAILAANPSYASMGETAEAIGTLTIEKAPYPGARIPAVSEVNEEGSEDEDNQYYWRSAADGNFRTAYYKLPENSNYREPEFIIPATTVLEGSLTKVTLGTGGWITTRAVGETVSLALSATNGSVSVWNGDAQVTAVTPLYAGQTLTLKAIPSSATYSTRPTWSSNVKVDDDGIATITLAGTAATVTATFKEKAKASLTKKNLTSTYTGTIFGSTVPEIKPDLSGWVISFEQDGLSVDQPTAAGIYQIVASRSEDDVYAATEGIDAGTLTIGKATAAISEVVGTDITIFQTLNQSVLSGTANVDGVFSWVNPNQTFEAAGENTGIDVLFTPTDANYAPVSGKATVTVIAFEGGDDITIRTLALTENDPVNGKGVVLTLNGTEVTAGTTVKAGDKLVVTFEAQSDYTASAKINGASYTSGEEFTIADAAGNIEIVITYTKTETDPGDVDVDNVSLDKSELSLALSETYTLIATISPANASDTGVTWESSDDEIATVDKDGKVTAVGIGTATITVTTVDGKKTATCVVTVTAETTGLEEIANTQVYSLNQAICIEPVMPVDVLVVSINGKLIYNNKITSTTQIPVGAAGVYIVKIGTGNNTSVRKISVK